MMMLTKEVTHGNIFCGFLHFPSSIPHILLSVGFDDKGRQFDKDGNMMQWWNNATIRNFRERAQCIIDQYSRYRIDEVGLYMNGRMTQGNLSLATPEPMTHERFCNSPS